MSAKLNKIAMVVAAMTMATGAWATGDTGTSVTGTASADASVIQPLSIEWVADLNFGRFTAPATDSSVTVSTLGAPTAGSGITMYTRSQSLNPTVSAAQFTVKGEPNYTYNVTFPAGDVTLTRSGGGSNPPTMVIKAGDFAKAGDTIGVTGSGTLAVGAKLTVSAGQASGAYHGSFDVVVAYN